MKGCERFVNVIGYHVLLKNLNSCKNELSEKCEKSCILVLIGNASSFPDLKKQNCEK